MEAAILNLQIGSGADTVAFGGNVKGSALEPDEAQSIVVVVFAVDTVFSGDDGEIGVHDAHVVLSGQTVGGAVDVVDAAGDLQRILGHDAVTCRGGDDENAAAVQGQVILGEDHGVDVVSVNGREGAAVGKSVGGARRQGEEHLVCLTDVNGCAGLTVDGHTVENQLSFVALSRVDDDHAVVQGAGENVGSLVGDGDVAAGDFHGIGAAGGGSTVELNDGALTLVITAVQIPVSKQTGSGYRLGDLRRGFGGRRVL